MHSRPEARSKSLSRKGSRSDPQREKAQEDPIFFVQKVCRQLVEAYQRVEDSNASEERPADKAKHSAGPGEAQMNCVLRASYAKSINLSIYSSFSGYVYVANLHRLMIERSIRTN